MSILKTVGLAASLMVATGLCVSAAKAVTFVADSTTPITATFAACGFACSPTTNGIVTVTEGNMGVGGTAALEFTVNLATGDAFIAPNGNGHDASFAFNSSISPLSFQTLTTGFSINSLSAGTVSMDGFGNFLFGVSVSNGNGGSSNGGSTLTFDIWATGLSLASIGGLSTNPPGSASVQFAADIIQGCNTGLTSCSGGTGIIGTGSVSPIPLPPAALLFGTALVGLGVLGRRRRKDGLAQAA
jgi:hypothetical protein